jgi:hypothetical protein
MYRIERQDQLYKTLLQALRFSPTIVIFSAFTLLLHLSGVFAPGSLTVTTKNFTNISHPCIIPTGNVSTPNSPDYASLFLEEFSTLLYRGPTPKANALALQWFVDKRIPDLPQACGPNCCYNVSVPSFVFQCTPNPSSLPEGQAGNPLLYFPNKANFWNGTIDPNSNGGFYIAWYSNYLIGSSGNAFCSPVQAQYNVKVRTIVLSTSLSLIFLKYQLKVQTKGGIQSVTMNITQINSAFPNVTEVLLFANNSIDNIKMAHFWMQLGAISDATREVFLGSGQPSF